MGTANSKNEAFGYTKIDALKNLLTLARGKYERNAYMEYYKCDEPDCCDDHVRVVFNQKRTPICMKQTNTGMYKAYFYH